MILSYDYFNDQCFLNNFFLLITIKRFVCTSIKCCLAAMRDIVKLPRYNSTICSTICTKVLTNKSQDIVRSFPERNIHNHDIST